MPIPQDKALYARVKKEADEKYDKPSAYKSMWIVKTYKQRGGTYLEDGKEKKLDRWRREKWVDVAKQDQYPVLRPTKRISKDTPLTVKEISTKELNKQIKLKQKLKGDKNLPAFEGGATCPDGVVGASPCGGAIRSDKLKLLSQSSYKPNKDIKDLTNHTLDRNLSTSETKVWVNPRKKELFIANRGTQGMSDWINNLSYVTGQYDKTRRYNRAKEIQMKAKNKYPMYKITNIGHSQSAGITRQLNKENLTNEIININPATLYNDRKNKSNEYTVRSKGDLVSIFHSPDKNTIQIKDKTFNPILEHKPRILDRLEPQKIGGMFIDL